MSGRIHVNDDNRALPCHAKSPQDCEFYRGEADPRHFTSMTEALAYCEQANEERYAQTGTLRAVPRPPHPKPVYRPKPPLRGAFKHGQVKRTAGQVKKHVSQMDDAEVEQVCAKLRGCTRMNSSRHLKDKMETEGLSIDPKLVFATVRQAGRENIIEYNERTYPDGGVSKRVLLRSTETRMVEVDGKPEPCHLCFVTDTRTWTMVTAYWNRADDHHNNIDMSRYDGDLQIHF